MRYYISQPFPLVFAPSLLYPLLFVRPVEFPSCPFSVSPFFRFPSLPRPCLSSSSSPFPLPSLLFLYTLLLPSLSLLSSLPSLSFILLLVLSLQFCLLPSTIPLLPLLCRFLPPFLPPPPFISLSCPTTTSTVHQLSILLSAIRARVYACQQDP